MLPEGTARRTESLYSEAPFIKIVLVAPVQEDAAVQNFPAPSLGLLRIMSYLRSRLGDGVDVEIYDSQIDSDHSKSEADLIVEHYQDKKIHIFGISVLHYTLVSTLELINKWRAVHSESLIIAGNIEAASNYQDIFDKSPCDMVVLGEGEDALLGIVMWKKGLRSLDDIEGVMWRSFAPPVSQEKLSKWVDGIDWASARYEQFWKRAADQYAEGIYNQQDNCVRIVTTNYCALRCKFCSLSVVHEQVTGKKTIPIGLYSEEMMKLVYKIKEQLPDARQLYFVSDDFFWYREEAIEFLCNYLNSPLNGYFTMKIQTHSRNIDEKTIQLLADCNCNHITIGAEQGSDRLRKILGKPQSTEKLTKIAEWGNRYGVSIYYLFILIPPEATLNDLWECVLQMDEWMSLGVRISIEPVVMAYRGTPYFDQTTYEYLSWIREIPGTGKKVKDWKWMLPADPTVRALAIELKEREADFVKAELDSCGVEHHFKGNTAPFILKLCKTLLLKYDPEGAQNRGIDKDRFLETKRAVAPLSGDSGLTKPGKQVCR